mgnify:CR=1 FL=1
MKRKLWPVDRVFGREFLFNIIPSSTTGVDIGVYRGDFSRLLIDETSPDKMYLVDPYMPD